MRLAWRSLRLVLVGALGAGTMGCVESYQGSWVEFTLRYVVSYNERRTVKDLLFTRILEEFGKAGDRVQLV